MTMPAYRDIVALFRQGATAEAEEKFLALRESLLEPLQQAHRGRTGELAAKAKLHWNGTAYYLIENRRKIGPLCPRCYDSERSLQQMQALDCVTYRCLACQTTYPRDLCG